MGTHPQHKKGAQTPIFSPCIFWPNGCMDQDAIWYRGRPRPRRHCVRWRPSSPSPKMGRSPPPQFSAHVYSGQTAAWIKMPFGTEVGLGPDDTVLDGDPAPPSPKKEQSPQFPTHFYLLWPNGCMDQDATWYGGRPWPTRHCVRRGLRSPSRKGGTAPNFRPMSVVAKQLDGLICHLVWKKASAQATLCSMGTQLPQKKGHTHSHSILGPCLLWPNGWMD